MAVAIPLLIVGLATSPVRSIGAPIPGAQEGNSILYLLLKLLVHGRILPGGGYDVMLNAIAFPAWFGLFITSLNLLPIGSLDGGHVTYAVFGRRQWQIARAAWMIMLGAGVLLLLTRFDLGLNVWLLWGLRCSSSACGIRRRSTTSLRSTRAAARSASPRRSCSSC